MLIRCMSDYFDQERKDLYHIEFTGLKNNDAVTSETIVNHAGRNELLAWFAEHLHDIKIEPIYTFTWKSGILAMPYDGTIAMHFDEQSLATFVARWEDGNDQSIDPRFRCMWTPLSVYMFWFDGKMPNKADYQEDYSDD